MLIDSLDAKISSIGKDSLLIPPTLSRWNNGDMIADFSERSKFRSQIELTNHEKNLSINEMRCRLLNDNISEENFMFFGTKNSDSLLSVDEFESDFMHQIFPYPLSCWKSPSSHDSGNIMNESIRTKSKENDGMKWDYAKNMNKSCAYTEADGWLDPSFNPMQSNTSIVSGSDEFGFNSFFGFPNINFQENRRDKVERFSDNSFSTSAPYNMKISLDLECSRLIDAHDGAALSHHHNTATGVSDSNANRGRRWTSHEDRLLLNAISARGKAPYNWKDVSTTAFFGSRNPYQVSL